MRRLGIATIGMLAIALSVSACAKNTGSTSTSTTTATQSSPSSMSGSMKKTAGTANGAQVFTSNCASCHQAQGQGVAGSFPPLAKNPVVTGDATKVIHIVKYGLNGKISVKGQSFNGMMPAWKGTLSDGDIASVITYIRSSWGNSASAVTTAAVTAVKK